MGRSDDIKIRTLPRPNEKASTATSKPKPVQPPPCTTEAELEEGEASSSSSTILFVGFLSLAVLGYVFFGPAPAVKTPAKAQTEQTDQSSMLPQNNKPKLAPNVDKFYNETEIKREMMIHQSEVMNYNFRAAAEDLAKRGDQYIPPDDSNLGVTLDGEDKSSMVFEDLNDDRSPSSGELSPVDRINARLANRKWINEHDKQERITALTAIIQNAANQGYELIINQDLVVTGVKKIDGTRRPISTNEALERLAKGQ